MAALASRVAPCLPSSILWLPRARTLASFSTRSAHTSSAAPNGAASRPPQIPRSMRGLPQRRNIPGVFKAIAVSSAKGGVGKSTTAANLAVALNGAGFRVGVLDADVFGPSIPIMFNLRGRAEVNEKGALVPRTNYGVQTMSMGYLIDEEAPVAWRGLMVMKAIQQLLFDVQWSSLDILVIDLPPGTGDTQLSISQLVHLDGAIIVSTPQDIALADAKKGLRMFEKVNVPILGLVQNMSFFCCPNCGHQSSIFTGRGGMAAAAKSSGVEVLADVPLDAEVCTSADLGRPIVISHPTSVHAGIYKALATKVAAMLGLNTK
ncbi:P-loop containing nucleoside triphosphate hydrolase protein [Zopfochytrium polystomum]|nr:P-loop containing nucleoside triphosphate hydrolase protein [Zopfochytrium polystomum]